ncbi:MAG: DUF4124 domain-containing protein [Betaproteobacteria bacterium]|nr:MAG: DUF4124 domain-containing protein [Betaproteobacteria bacterium]
MRAYRFLHVLAVCGCLVALPTQAAMYKWVDENGNVNYGDSVPPKYASKVSDRAARPGSVKWERAMASLESSPSEQELAKQRSEAKAQQERKRLDTALLSTYSNEAEIETARERELRRSQETLKVVSAGLAGSSSPEDRQKLDALINQSRRETDAINARFDAQKARFRELTAPPTTAQATSKPSAK